MKQRLSDLIDKHGMKHWSFAARKDQEFMDFVQEKTASLPTDLAYADRVYAAVSGDSPICAQGGRRSLKNIKEGWRFCGRAASCACAAQSVSEKGKAAWSKIDGQERAAIVERRIATLEQRHGVDNPGKLDHAVSAHRAFYADPSLVTAAVEKGRLTMLATHGVDNALKLPKVDAFRRQLASLIGSARRKQAGQKRSEKARRGNLLDHSYRRLVARYAALGFEMLTPRERWIGVGGTGKRITYEFGCMRCGIVFHDRVYDGHNPSCPDCDATKPQYVSREEDDVANYVASLGVRVIRTSRKTVPGFELDIVVPELRIAIEYCGLYWHSEIGGGKARNHHLTKLEACEAAGYRLVTIFSDEWLGQRDMCERRLAHILGQEQGRIYARRTQVCLVQATFAREFLGLHHIQGYAPGASVHYGLLHGGKVVAVMTFGKLRASHNHEQRDGAWELYRFASSPSVVGGASKLFRAFVRQYRPKTVLSFCDRRWGTGRVYEQMGFVCDGHSAPGYAWVEKYAIRHYRYNFAKHRLVAAGHDPSLSEVQIMRNLKFDRIWDCGNLRFVWKSPPQPSPGDPS